MKSISRKKSSTSQSWVIFLVGIIFLAVGIAVFTFLSGLPLYNWYNAQDWEVTPCTIESSRVASHSDSDGTTYSVDIHYRYRWNDVSYAGDQYNFFSGSSSGRSAKKAAVAQYPKGSERKCFVNPDNPEEAVLNRDFSLAYLIGCFGLIFALVGAGLLYAGLRSGKEKSGALSSHAQSQPDAPWNAARAYGTVTLKADSNSAVGCGFLLVFGAIWNGIVITAFWSMLQETSPPLVGLLFLIPFVLVGVAILAGVIYCFLALFNPRPELTLTPGTLPLGGTAELTWHFHGSTARISQLTITVKGEEKATYRRGTSTTTDTSVFEKMVLLDSTSPVEIREGRVQFTIPEFTAPTFEASNNKIVWHINVHGDIKRWPDVNRDFDLIVVPLPRENPMTPDPATFREL